MKLSLHTIDPVTILTRKRIHSLLLFTWLQLYSNFQFPIPFSF